ncbi:hypothetical protein GOV11_00740 [Candidatus Woesearchaeota archaeon]|nr:hypothetical protein [Candidatus Woesearchaeota archaeon]
MAVEPWNDLDQSTLEGRMKSEHNALLQILSVLRPLYRPNKTLEEAGISHPPRMDLREITRKLGTSDSKYYVRAYWEGKYTGLIDDDVYHNMFLTKSGLEYLENHGAEAYLALKGPDNPQLNLF